MQLTSRWLPAIGAAMFCVAMCLAVDYVAAQSPQTIGIASTPDPPIVLDLAGTDALPEANAAPNSVVDLSLIHI